MCPDENALAALLEGTLPAAEAQALKEHLADCASCRQVVAQGDQPALVPGSLLLERYVVLHEVGGGAMGVVFAAWDNRLDRKVALKVLHPGTEADRQGRLEREARSLARLSHPNVVSVYDVGASPAGLFVAMEFVEGETLTQWLARKPTQPEVLRVFLDAARGLNAAHLAGLVHRDFKPDNVLLGKDGRVRVSDFGLARAAPALPPPAAVPRPTLEVHDAAATATGAMVGTPVYMAPEVLEGAAADARSDQFSFAVALFEALTGARPFRAATVADLKAQMAQPIAFPSLLPGWVQRLLSRGLAAVPAHRFSSMAALIATLEHTPQQRQRRVVIATVAAVGLALVGGSVWLTRSSSATVCRGGAERVALHWGDEARRAVKQRLLTSRAPFAADTVRAVEQSFDGFARDWAAMHRDACEATRVRGEQSDALLDLRMQCLDGRLAALDAAVVTLKQLDAADLENVPRLLGTVGGLAACADAVSLANAVPLPASEDDRRAIAALRGRVAQLLAQSEAGEAKAALPAAEQAVVDARALGYRPLEAEALLALAAAQLYADPARQAGTLSDAALAAEAAGGGALLVRALCQQAERASESEPAVAQALVRRARAALERLHDADLLDRTDLTEAGLLNGIGKPAEAVTLLQKLVARHPPGVDAVLLTAKERFAEARSSQGRLAEARALYEEVVAGREATVGGSHPLYLDALKNLGGTKDQLSDFAGARADLERVLALAGQVYGLDHPRAARAQVNLANTWYHQGDARTAATLYAQALAIFEKADPGPSRAKALTMGNLAAAWSETGRETQAVDLMRKEIAMLEVLYEPEHPEVAVALATLANFQFHQGKVADAIATLQRALDIEGKRLPADHPDLAHGLLLMADFQQSKGDRRLARQLAQRGLAGLRSSAGADAIDTAPLESFIASLDVDEGQPAQALPVFERLVAVYEQRGEHDLLSARNRFYLAKALRATQGEGARVCELARVAKQDYQHGGQPKDLAQVERFLAAQCR